MSALGASGSNSGGNVLVDAGQLLQELEVGATLVTVLFTVYDIDDSITKKSNTPEPLPQWAFGPKVIRSESNKVVDDERFFQDQAQKLYSALDAVSSSLRQGTELSIGIEDVCVDESLLCILALAIMEQVAVDDRAAALAVENGRTFPSVTECQKVVQNERFFGLLGEGLT